MNKLFMFLLVGLLLVGFGSAWSSTTFNNSLGTENITFTKNENHTRWLSVPEGASVTSAVMNLSGYSSEEGDYITSWDTNADGNTVPVGITTDGTNIWTTQGNSAGGVYKWTMNGTYISSWGTNGDGCTFPSGITTDGTNIWVVSSFEDEVFKWTMDGTYVSNWDTNADGNTNPVGITTDGTNIWTVDFTGREVYKWTMDGTAVTHWDTNADGNYAPRGITTNGTNIWTTDSSSADGVWKWTMDGTHISSWNTNTSGNVNPLGITTDGTNYIWTTDGTIDEVYKWALDTLLLNPSISINDTQIWNYTGAFNETFSPNQTDDFSTAINGYTSTASAVAGYYLVPFIFHSDTAGILEYLGLDFSNDGFIENSQTYNNPVIGLNIENFSINITYDSEEFTNAFGYLIYNGTSYSATKSGSGNTVIFNKAIQIPQVTTQENVTFYWQIVLNNGTNNYYNSTLNNQTINVLGIDNCSAYTYPLANINLFDEEHKTSLLGDIELNYEILNTAYIRSNFINLSLENVSSVNLCSNSNMTDSSFLQSVEIRYVSEGYAPELYHIQRAEITEDNYTINLYDLNSTSSTEFKITYQDDTFKFVEGAVVQLLRKYIAEDAYEVVEAPLTSSQGIAVVHVDLNSVKYKVIVVKNGVILDIFPNIVFKCQSELTGECEQKLLGEINPQNDVPITTLRDFSYSIAETNSTVTVTFSIPSGLPSLVNILLSQTDQWGNTTLCNKSLTSSSGSIECDYLDTIGDSVLTLNIYKGGVPMAIRTFLIPEAGGWDFLDNNYFIVFLLLLSIVGMAISSPEWIILNSVVTLFLAGALYLLNGLDFVMGFGALMWLVIAAAILIFKLAKQEDR